MSITTRVNGAIAGDVAGRVDAAHARHVQVHDDDVGSELAHDPHGLGAARRLADDLDSLLLEQVAEACPEQVVVVDDQHAERVGLTLLGWLQHFAQIAPPPGAAHSSGA